MDRQSVHHAFETHEQFLSRANRVFSASSTISGTKLERAVFNYLMKKLIDCHGYAGISNAMLYAALDDTQSIVRHCRECGDNITTADVHAGVGTFWAEEAES